MAGNYFNTTFNPDALLNNLDLNSKGIIGEGYIGIYGAITVDNIRIDCDTISTLKKNTNLSLDANGGTTIIEGIKYPKTAGNVNQVLGLISSDELGWFNVSGVTGITSLLEDLTPQLGGDLDLNGNSILGIGSISVDNLLLNGNTISSTNTNGDIILDANGTGNTIIDGNIYPNVQGTNGQVLTTNGAGVLTWEDSETGWGTDTFTISDGSNTSIISSNEIVTIQSGTNTTVILNPSTNTYSINAITGTSGITEVLEDLTPQLGGDLDLNNNDISGDGNINITGDITATGDGQFSDILITANTITNVNNGDIILDATGTGNTIIDGNTYPNTAGTNGQVLKTDGVGVLDWEDDYYVSSASFDSGSGTLTLVRNGLSSLNITGFGSSNPISKTSVNIFEDFLYKTVTSPTTDKLKFSPMLVEIDLNNSNGEFPVFVPGRYGVHRFANGVPSDSSIFNIDNSFALQDIQSIEIAARVDTSVLTKNYYITIRGDSVNDDIHLLGFRSNGGFWETFTTSNLPANTTANITTVPVDGDFHNFKTVLTPTSITFSIDGVNLFTHTTNLPDQTLGLSSINFRAISLDPLPGANTVYFDLDYIDIISRPLIR